MYTELSIKIFILFYTFHKIENVDIPGDICEGLSQRLLAHPDPSRCTEFIVCVHEMPHVFSCLRPNEIFYLPASDCLPGDPETCQLLSLTTTLKTTTSTDATTEFEESTPKPSSVYDSTMISDISPDLTTNEPITTKKVPTTTIKSLTTTEILIDRCPPGGFGYIPHPINCNRYFECIAGVRHLRSCPEGLLFDSVKLRCTSPELAVCAGAH